MSRFVLASSCKQMTSGISRNPQNQNQAFHLWFEDFIFCPFPLEDVGRCDQLPYWTNRNGRMKANEITTQMRCPRKKEFTPFSYTSTYADELRIEMRKKIFPTSYSPFCSPPQNMYILQWSVLTRHCSWDYQHLFEEIHWK